MQISRRDWENYINALARVNQTAADAMQYWMDDNPGADTDELIYTASLLSDRYGEAAASLACEMYDRTAAAQGVTVPPAEPAPTATYHETAKAVTGTMKNQRNSVPQTVGRLVKQAGADTMLKNAKRDGAEFAWVPHGDTCSFCLMLASNGWTNATEGVAKGNHAEHIHANCDCTFAVRFDGKSGVKGYDPEKYRRMYENAEGDTWQEKLNSMRRADYAERRDEINAQKRAAYARRNDEKKSVIPLRPIDVTEGYLKSATPGIGAFVVEDEDHRDIHSDEIRIAELIHRKLGGDILVRKEIPGQENADYLWRTHLWELKSPQSENNFNKLIQKGISQTFNNPGGIVVDRGDINLERAIRIINGRMKTSLTHQLDVMIVSGETIEIVLRYKK